MKAQITITWNPEAAEETKVTISQGFKQLSALERLDCLQDAIAVVEHNYEMAYIDFEHENLEITRRAINGEFGNVVDFQHRKRKK